MNKMTMTDKMMHFKWMLWQLRYR